MFHLQNCTVVLSFFKFVSVKIGTISAIYIIVNEEINKIS